MAAVTHGRRKGQRYGSPGGTGSIPPKQQDQSLVIPGREWARITKNLSGYNKEEQMATMKQQEKVYLREKSKAMVKHWQNTIEGQRLKKLEARKLREEDEEEERVKVDIQEAQYQGEQRKKAIEKAKIDLYYQTDRVKKFHGALMLSEVLREREAQIDIKKRREQLVKKRDETFEAVMEEERRKGNIQEMIKAEKQLADQAKVSKFQLIQAAENHRGRQKARQDALEEQSRLENEDKEYYQKGKELEEKKLQDKKVYRATLEDLLVEKKAFQAENKRMEDLEVKETQLYANAKKRMVKMRKEKEDELFKKFQDGQNRMVMSLEEQTKTEKSNEDERIAQAVAEGDAKRVAAETEKMKKNIEMQTDIAKHRVEMITEQEQKRKEEMLKDRDLLQRRMIQDQKFHAHQLDKHCKARNQAKQLSEFYKTQAVDRQFAEDELKQASEEYNGQNLDLLHLEEEQFHHYTQKVIDEAKARGANTKPLKKAAVKGSGGGHGPVFEGKGGLRPSYMAMDSLGVQLPSYQSKSKGAIINTQKRIGFTW